MNYYQNQTVFGNHIPVMIEDNKIYQLSYTSENKKLIGYTESEYNSKMELLDTYYNKLVDMGVIEKEKTPEEIQQENTKLINKLLTKIEDLEKKVSVKDESKRNDKSNGKDV